MTISLKGMSKKELEKLRRRIDKELEKATKADLKAARNAAEKAVSAFGVSLSDLVDGAPAKKPGKKRGPKKAAAPGKPKYKNPADPKQTWTGKGRRPQWVLDALDAGKKLESMAIK